MKRVVGLPGDLIEIRRRRLAGDESPVGTLYVNRSPATYSDLDLSVVEQIADYERYSYRFATETLDGRDHPVMILPGRHSEIMAPFTVPEGQYFLMGDNRNNSRDSRYFGAVPRHLILGEATAVALSVDRDAYYMPRWGRFFSRLP